MKQFMDGMTVKDVLIASNDFLLSGAKSSSFGASSSGTSFGASSGDTGQKKEETESMIPKLVMYCLTRHLRGDPDLDKDDVSIMIQDFKCLLISISH